MALDESVAGGEDLASILSAQHKEAMSAQAQNNRDLITAIHQMMTFGGSTRQQGRTEAIGSVRRAFGNEEQWSDLQLRAQQAGRFAQGAIQQIQNLTQGQTKSSSQQTASEPPSAGQPDPSQQQPTQQAATPSASIQALGQEFRQVISLFRGQQPTTGAPAASTGAPVTPPAPTGGGAGQPPAPPPVPAAQPSPGPLPPPRSTTQMAAQPPGLVNKGWAGLKSYAPALGLAENLLHEFRSQQDKNNFYRSMTGGTHGEAINERIGEEMFRLPTMLSFSEQEARQTYKGVTALGYSQRGPQGTPGSTREDMMNFVYESKQGFGASVGESLSRLEVTSRNANINVTGLVDSLSDLSDSAGQAGVNAQQARAQFDAMTSASSAFGSTSTTYAQGAVESQVMLGREFTNLDPTKQVVNQGYRYMVAASQGMSLSEFNAQSMNNPAASSNAMTGMFLQNMQNYIQGSSGEAWDWLVQQVNQQKRALAQEPGRVSMQIAETFWRTHAGTMDPNAFLQMANQFSDRGGFTDHLQAMAYLVTQMAGQTQGAIQAEAQAKTGMTNIRGQSTGQKGLSGAVGEQGLAEGDKEGSAVGGLRALSVQGRSRSPVTGKMEDQTEVTSSYLDQARRSGKRSPVLEAMLQGMDASEEKDQFVEVQTPTGFRVVHLSVAMKHYRNQMMSGQARFVGGEHGGENIGAYTGGKVDESRADEAQGEAKSKGKWSKKGFTREEWYKEHPEDRPDQPKSWTGARVKIDLTSRAAQALKVVGYDEADASGEPKENSIARSASRGGAVNYNTT